MTAPQLFAPLQVKSLRLKNRIVMALMTRSFSPNGVPASNVADYYDRRAAGGGGWIISEGTVVQRPASSNDPDVPRFFGEKSLAGWKGVIDKVHADGGVMAPQLWHMGVVAPKNSSSQPPAPFEGRSGYVAAGKIGGIAMTQQDITRAARLRPRRSTPKPWDSMLWRFMGRMGT
jgi:2,4-dienoyl-CoA reductase-like NADH-dependent reductase (Old Yellow Enzyme family)